MSISLLRRGSIAASKAAQAFVTRDAATGNLMLGGQRYRFSGANAGNDIGHVGSANGNGYGGTVVGDAYLTPHSQIDAYLDSAEAMNARVIRAFAAAKSTGDAISVQPTLGSFNAAALEPLDYALQQCALRGMKLIIPLTDEYSDKPWFVANTGGGTDDNFVTRTATINAFKAHISFVLDHVNTYTGITYKNDPTVLAWETINEGTSSGAGSAAFATWTDTISQHIKITKGAQQLVMDGGYGITSDGSTYDTTRLGLTYVDMVTDHTYDTTRTPRWLEGEGAAAHSFGKAFYVGEYDWTGTAGWTLPQLLFVIDGSAYIDGDAFWDLLAPDTDWADGFTLHYPGDDAGMISAVGQLSDHADYMTTATPNAPFLTDTFTDTNSTLLQSHTGEGSVTWAKQSGSTGDGTITSNRVWFGTPESNYYLSSVPSGADYEVTGTVYIASALTNCRLTVNGRMSTGAKTFYGARLFYDGSTYQVFLVKVVAGTSTTLVSRTIATPTVGTTHTLTLRMIGDQIAAKWDGVSIANPQTSNDITAAGRAGCGANSGGAPAMTSTTGFHLDSITANAVP